MPPYAYINTCSCFHLLDDTPEAICRRLRLVYFVALFGSIALAGGVLYFISDKQSLRGQVTLVIMCCFAAFAFLAASLFIFLEVTAYKTSARLVREDVAAIIAEERQYEDWAIEMRARGRAYKERKRAEEAAAMEEAVAAARAARAVTLDLRNTRYAPPMVEDEGKLENVAIE
ncbi:uncharacterized protein F4807DRAFT_463429 [Annulohypoxylon truncatum]|uniref:uncharacterized protein n=1 Tax=Annulohypoxylon truncatum TaxID=327061 RepID=UPI0020089B34|nr:uncharacterized protein F4807DRAFT_463429 [Annulohypoxylon truncatum]KAI1206740.1 hypothetical protein F4807DRAFT_463429 [Annulohypoxylon truncatum]